MEDRNFEPYIDWDAMTDEMADDVHRLVVRYRDIQNELISSPEASRKAHAIDLLKTQDELGQVFQAVRHTLFVMPMMVHIAGPKQHAETEDGEEQVLQRCQRCGSVLQCWEENCLIMTPEGPLALDEDEFPWWSEGDVVAKSSAQGDSTAFYRIDDGRALHAHEKPCPDLAKIIS